jgi:hypothetical protein
MKKVFYFWSIVLIASLVTLGLCIRYLALGGVPVSESLVLRGVSCLIFVSIFARAKNLTLRPVSLRGQAFRAAIAGLALTLISWSYTWLSASAVAVLSNIDVPLLVILGPLVGVAASARARGLSLLSICFLAFYVVSMEPSTTTLFRGLGTLILGTLLLCAGYFFIKKSMAEENEAVTILTPAVAILFYGIVESLFISTSNLPWSPAILATAVVSGAAMFVAYFATMKLYERADVAHAEFPTLLASLFIQPFEAVFLREPLLWQYLLATVGFVGVTYFILKIPTPADPLTTSEPDERVDLRMGLPLVAQTLDFTCGAACFESLYRYFRREACGELHYARELGTLELGYTPIENVLALTQRYGFHCEMKSAATLDHLRSALAARDVAVVTWWDEDAGHYSLVSGIDQEHILLMDPWEAREGKEKRLRLNDFVPLWQTRGAVLIRVSDPLRLNLR